MVSKCLPTDCCLAASSEKSRNYGEGRKHSDWVIRLTSPMRDRWPLWPQGVQETLPAQAVLQPQMHRIPGISLKGNSKIRMKVLLLQREKC